LIIAENEIRGGKTGVFFRVTNGSQLKNITIRNNHIVLAPIDGGDSYQGDSTGIYIRTTNTASTGSEIIDGFHVIGNTIEAAEGGWVTCVYDVPIAVRANFTIVGNMLSSTSNRCERALQVTDTTKV